MKFVKFFDAKHKFNINNLCIKIIYKGNIEKVFNYTEGLEFIEKNYNDLYSIVGFPSIVIKRRDIISYNYNTVSKINENNQCVERYCVPDYNKFGTEYGEEYYREWVYNKNNTNTVLNGSVSMQLDSKWNRKNNCYIDIRLNKGKMLKNKHNITINEKYSVYGDIVDNELKILQLKDTRIPSIISFINNPKNIKIHSTYKMYYKYKRNYNSIWIKPDTNIVDKLEFSESGVIVTKFLSNSLFNFIKIIPNVNTVFNFCYISKNKLHKYIIIVVVNEDNEIHNIKGPALIDIENSEQYWLNNNVYRKEDWIENIKKLNVKRNLKLLNKV